MDGGARMQNWMWIVVGLTSGGLVVGALVILLAMAASHSTQ
jgi:hypothetical protein